MKTIQDAGLNSKTGVKSLKEMLLQNRSLLEKMRIRIRPEAREVRGIEDWRLER